MDDAAAQLDGFIDEYAPDMAALARALLARLTARLPGAPILVYDNYNALAVGFSASERARDVVISFALYPRWANLFFMHGRMLDDPHGLLKGKGSRVRHIPQASAATLDDPRVDALIEEALDKADLPIDPSAAPRTIIKAVSDRQRSRLPKA